MEKCLIFKNRLKMVATAVFKRVFVVALMDDCLFYPHPLRRGLN